MHRYFDKIPIRKEVVQVLQVTQVSITFRLYSLLAVKFVQPVNFSTKQIAVHILVPIDENLREGQPFPNLPSKVVTA